jgi:hypothetical protein
MRHIRAPRFLAVAGLAAAFLGIVALVQSTALASQTKQCRPAHWDAAVAPTPCAGNTSWQTAIPGACDGPLGILTCVMQGTTNVDIKQYSWHVDETGDCAGNPTGVTDTVRNVAQCHNQ